MLFAKFLDRISVKKVHATLHHMTMKRRKTKGITNLILLRYMQEMRTSLEERMDRMEEHQGQMETRLERIEKDIVFIKDALQRLYAHRLNMLVRIERLEKTVGIAS